MADILGGVVWAALAGAAIVDADAAGSREPLIDGADPVDDALATEEWLTYGGGQQSRDAAQDVLDLLTWAEHELAVEGVGQLRRPGVESVAATLRRCCDELETALDPFDGSLDLAGTLACLETEQPADVDALDRQLGEVMACVDGLRDVFDTLADTLARTARDFWNHEFDAEQSACGS